MEIKANLSLSLVEVEAELGKNIQTNNFFDKGPYTQFPNIGKLHLPYVSILHDMIRP